MFLETDLKDVTVVLLGASQDSRTARRLRVAGAAVTTQVEADVVPGFVLVVGPRAPWETELATVHQLHGAVPVATVEPERTGVTLVGGGPGADDLLTARGLSALADADVVLLDRLAPQEVVSAQAPHAQIIRVGKWPGHHPVPQEQIQSILLNSARDDRHVVRLKGGDPYVFGRGGEEAADCETWGVPVEVVPGITSAVAVPGAAGIPVTFREVARTFTVASGHVPFTETELHGFCTLLETGATLVVLMGVATLPQLVSGLVRNGAPATTPIAVVEKGFSPDQKVHTSILNSAVVELAGAGSPAVTVIGPVAALAAEDRERVLGELTPHRAVANSPAITMARSTTSASTSPDSTSTTTEANPTVTSTDHPDSPASSGETTEPLEQESSGPLAGKTVVVTAHRRADDQIGALQRKGAATIAAPALKLVPVDQDADVVSQSQALVNSRPDLVVVTTGYGFKRWWDVVEASGLSQEVHAMLAAADIWVRGPKGRAAVRNLGLYDVGISPDETIGPLVDEILDAYDHDLTGVVIAWQENGYHDREQRQRLVEAGAVVHTVVPHRWADADDAGMIPRVIRQVCDRQVDAVTFTSAAGSDAVLSTASEMGLEEQFVAAFSPAPAAQDGSEPAAQNSSAPAAQDDSVPGTQDGSERSGEATARTVVAATVGPVTAAPLVAAGIPALVPERFRMGAMINQLAERLRD
ncbi:uroporphyrinogen-III C-methyltransferase [Kocuria sp.]|uniref:uroporphyrinogen-III C-methyltransferase n=1 Tax=Kocuria sp. TaxID=1871328 RepID=UPI003F8D2227